MSKAALKHGYKSGLEDKVAEQLKESGIKVEYEKLKIRYRVEEERTYTPDFQLPNGIIIETKGRFVLEDRKKHLRVKEQHPHLDIRFVFTNPHAKLRKGAKSTYADWCDKHGFKWAAKLVPQEWIDE